MADTKRITSGQVSVRVDTSRKLSKLISVAADTLRISTSVSFSVTVSVDTMRTKAGAVSVSVDTKRKRRGDLSDVVSLSIGLQNQTLADTYQINTLIDAPLGKIYSGALFGWPWECTLSQKTFDPASKRYTMRGDFDVSDTLKKYIKFDLSARSASSVLAALAGQLGKSLVNITDDHGVRRMSEQATVMQVLSSLYGWTTAAPSIVTNVFIRGDTLYAVQRGKETGSYSPVKYNITGYDEKKLDTLMNSGLWSPQIIGDPTGEYTNGTYGFNGCSIEYVNGYVVRTVDSSGAVMTFSWSSDDPSDPDVQCYMLGSTECQAGEKYPYYTSYYYDTWKGSRYLASEITTQTKTFTYIIPVYPYVASIKAMTYYKKVNHAPAGNGFYASSGIEEKWTYDYLVDEKTGSVAGFGLTEYEAHDLPSQISEGRPGGAVTPREQSAEDTTPVIDVAHIPFASSHIPVTDATTLTRYYNALAALDGAIEYQMTIDCYDEHIIDYTETVVIDGTVWYLDGNSILLSGDKPYRKQTVNLVRWA